MPDPPSAACANLAAVAQEAGVSRMTVSRVLRNAGYAAHDTRQRVLAAADRLGYRPNPMVSALMTQIHQGKLSRPDHVLAYLTNSRARGGWRDNPTYGQFFDGATARAAQRGYRVEEYWLGDHGFSAARLSRVLYARGVRGVIVGPIASSHGHLNLKWEHFCPVAIGYSLLRPALDRVSNDQYDSTLLALRELRRLGYRRIGVAGRRHAAERVHYRWPSATLMYQWRYGQIDEALLHFPDVWRRESFLEWFRAARVDALATLEPEAYGWLQEAGYRVPEEVGVAQLDLASFHKPLAGVDQRSAAVGAGAVDAVIERINNNELGVPAFARTVALPGKWVSGETVRCVAQPRTSSRRRNADETPANHSGSRSARTPA
ncbi:MAG: LacI family DNA-binding transcriptional regulator [Rhodospirillales bacterium]|nr:LacI family DNA-binding transcriptional regulator [Acetobacter sp.]